MVHQTARSYDSEKSRLRVRLTVNKEKKDGSFHVVVCIGHEAGHFQTKTSVVQFHVQ